MRSMLTSPTEPLLHISTHCQNVAYMDVTQHQRHPLFIR